MVVSTTLNNGEKNEQKTNKKQNENRKNRRKFSPYIQKQSKRSLNKSILVVVFIVYREIVPGLTI
jgi:hypothetical protein